MLMYDAFYYLGIGFIDGVFVSWVARTAPIPRVQTFSGPNRSGVVIEFRARDRG
jgi:hypothetical protein